jgi:hypothetical protein
MKDKSKPELPKTEKVGYGNPPEPTRFKPGQSGNPKGRPKGSFNIATVLERGLREKVIINENGRRKIITKLEASIKQLVNKAAAGDLRALQQLTALARGGEERASEASSPKTAMTDVDRKVMEGVLRRFGAKLEGAEDEDDESESK